MPLINRHSNTEGIVYETLHRLGITEQYSSVKDELFMHPDYPSLLAVSDVLNSFDISNQAYNVSINNLNKLTPPFIAHTNKSNGEFLLVNKINKENLFVHDGKKSRQLQKEHLAEVYSGIVLVFENINESRQRPPFSSMIDTFKRPILFSFIVCAFVFYLITGTNYFFNLTLSVVSTTALKTIGVLSTILLLEKVITGKDSVTDRICDGVNSNCDAILNSKAASFMGTSWSEIGFFYFAGTLILLLLNSNSTPTLQILGVVSLLCIPYTFYSIYYQWRVAKQWCIVCCIVQGVIILDFLTLFPFLKSRIELPGLLQLISYLIMLLTPAILWLLMKPFFIQGQTLLSAQQQLRDFKFNRSVFLTYLRSQPKYSIPDESWSIALGKAGATNIITIVSNPFCVPCADLHSYIERWLQQEPEVQFRIIFTTNDDRSKKAIVVRHLMSLNQLSNRSIVSDALSEWYGQQKKNIMAWQLRYPAEYIEDVRQILEKQNAWCVYAGVTATPRIYINGQQLPSSYNLNEIKYLLNG